MAHGHKVCIVNSVLHRVIALYLRVWNKLLLLLVNQYGPNVLTDSDIEWDVARN